MNSPVRIRRIIFSTAPLLLICCMLVFWSRWASSGSTLSAHAAANGNVPVFTFKYNNQHTGANINEIALNTHNVNGNRFGRLMSYPVDGQIYAQPLYAPGVNVGGKGVNMVIAATESNSIYAFDADEVNGNTAPIWQDNFENNNARTVTANDVNCPDMMPNIGITSTPVIDPATNTLFLTSYLISNGNFTYFIHALDLSTGRDKAGSPAEVHVPGSSFNPKMERQRTALLLANGRLYLGFSSFCDNAPYNGWIISYSYNGRSFQRLASYDDTPGGVGGGIWGSGGALAADPAGYIYATTGNGTFNLNSGGHAAGDSYLKMTANLQVVNYFTPFDQHCLYTEDGDLGSGGTMLTPGGEMISGTKDGKVFVVSTGYMGGYNASVNNPCARQGATNFDHIIQELPQHTMGGGVYSIPAYWAGPGGPFVYFSGTQSSTKVFRLAGNRLTAALSQTPETFGFTGGNPIISSNGAVPGTGILWVIDSGGYLRAYDATNLKNELYSSAIDGAVKFSTPIVSNGKVFVPTTDSLDIFGLQSGNTASSGEHGGNLSGTLAPGLVSDNRAWRHA